MDFRKSYKEYLLTAFLLCLSVISGFSQEKAERSAQRIQFKNIRLVADQLENDIRGFRINYDLSFQYSLDEINPEGKGISYRIIAYLTGPAGLRVPAVPDARSLMSVDGYVYGRESISLENQVHILKDRSIFMPWYALALPEGLTSLKARIEVLDSQDDAILGQGTSDIQDLTKPKAALIRVIMDEFEVNALDSHNENWDYYFINPLEARPDPKWKLFRGNALLYASEKLKNEFIYLGGPEDHTGYFSLSEGDKMRIVIIEHDVTTLSDKIGEWEMDPLSGDYPFGEKQKVSFAKVDRMEFQVEKLGNSSVDIGGLKVEDDAHFEGMSGVFVKFNYEFEKALPNQQFWGKLYLEDENRPPVKHIYGVNGKVRIDNSGEFKFDSQNKGTLKLFIPHYVLAQLPEKGASIVIRLETDVQGKRYLAAHSKAKAEPRETYIRDLTFPKAEIQADLVDGISGILIHFHYQIPPAYFDRLTHASYSIQPEFLVDLKPLANGSVSLLDLEGASQREAQLDLDYGQTEGGGRYFIPFHALGQNSGMIPVTVKFTAQMLHEELETIIGIGEKSERIDFPGLDSLRIHFKEVKIKKSAMKGRKLNWRVSLGNRIVYTSISGKGRKRLFWSPDQITSVRGSINDRVKIELVNGGALSGKILIETWEYSLNELRAWRGKKLKLKSKKVRSLIGEVL